MKAPSPSALVDAADRLALVVSGACVLHCLGLPLLFATLPVLSRLAVLPESLHLWLVAGTVPLSGYALLVGRRSHSDDRPLLIGTIGLVLLAVGAVTLPETHLETVVTVAGGMLVAVAHMWNWRRRHGPLDHH